MTNRAWRDANPMAWASVELGKSHAYQRAWTRVEFLDHMELDITDIRDGYPAGALYMLYLRARVRAASYIL